MHVYCFFHMFSLVHLTREWCQLSSKYRKLVGNKGWVIEGVKSSQQSVRNKRVILQGFFLLKCLCMSSVWKFCNLLPEIQGDLQQMENVLKALKTAASL